MRVYELAKELGVTSAVVLACCLTIAGCDATHPSNSLTDDEATQVRACVGASEEGGATDDNGGAQWPRKSSASTAPGQRPIWRR